MKRCPSPLEILPIEFYLRDAETLAGDLLGCLLLRFRAGSAIAVARIVETEAYLGAKDPASHAAGGRRTARTQTLYRVGGCAYIYLIYGIHHCLNVVAGPAGEAQAVLIRAIVPVEGVEWMKSNRGLGDRIHPGELGGGPGKLCQALAIDRSLDGASLVEGPVRVAVGTPVPADRVARGPRIGVGYAGEAAAWPLRFGIAGCREMSRPVLDVRQPA